MIYFVALNVAESRHTIKFVAYNVAERSHTVKFVALNAAEGRQIKLSCTRYRRCQMRRNLLEET